MPFQVFEAESRSILTPTSGFIAQAGFTHSLSPARNCTFACTYCYVPTMGLYGGLKPADWEHWGEFTTFKSNAPDLLRRSLRPSMAIYCSPLVDPYQPVESDQQLMPRILDAVMERPPRVFVIQTRGPLVCRDLTRLCDLWPAPPYGSASLLLPTAKISGACTNRIAHPFRLASKLSVPYELPASPHSRRWRRCCLAIPSDWPSLRRRLRKTTSSSIRCIIGKPRSKAPLLVHPPFASASSRDTASGFTRPFKPPFCPACKQQFRMPDAVWAPDRRVFHG